MEQKLKCDVYIGKNLRRLREKFGLSQEKLCAELQCRNCDIGRSTYAKYENGELNIRISVLMELKKMWFQFIKDFLYIFCFVSRHITVIEYPIISLALRMIFSHQINGLIHQF